VSESMYAESNSGGKTYKVEKGQPSLLSIALDAKEGTKSPCAR